MRLLPAQSGNRTGGNPTDSSNTTYNGIMNALTQFIQNHMVLVFFVYGLSFFLLGTAVSFQARKGSGFRVGRYLWMLGAFGLLHGLHEWQDMFLILGDPYWNQAEIRGIEILRFFVGQISYIFLFQFGLSLLVHGQRTSTRLPRCSLAIYGVAVIGLLVWGLRSQFDSRWFHNSDIAVWYLLALPGAVLTAAAFYRETRSPEMRQLGAKSVMIGLVGLAVAFAVYAVLAGIIVREASFFPASIINYATFLDLTGLPVQFLRACSAIAMVVFLSNVLAIFELETKHKLEHAYQEVMRISNQDQMRIGQDLHDGLGQHLAGTAYIAKALEKTLRSDSPDAALSAEQISKLLDESVAMTRALSRGLYPVSLEEHGLGFALKELAENTERMFHVECIAVVDESIRLPTGETSLHLFRIVQEAVSNAGKHARANRIQIGLHDAREGITLQVADDGSGIPNTTDPEEGIGFRTMHYRAGLIGAQLTIRPGSDKGTVVLCSLPASPPGKDGDRRR